MVSLSIDLSGYVGDLAKPFATQLHANDDSTRESAVKCVASLALKCSDSEAILTLLKSIFAVLNGSEGKLTVADHKISLLNAAAALADNSILGECFTDIFKEHSNFRSKVLASCHEWQSKKLKILLSDCFAIQNWNDFYALIREE